MSLEPPTSLPGGGEMGTTPLPGEIWGFQGGGQEEEGKDLRRLVDPNGSADDGKR